MPGSNIETRLFINNEFVEAKGGATFPLHNPSTEEPLVDVSAAQLEDVNRAVDAADTAFPSWSSRRHSERAALLYKLSELIERDGDLLAELQGKEMGAPFNTARHTVGQAADSLRHIAALTLTTLGESSLNTPGTLALDLRQPFGVVAGIIPWNVPIIMLAWKIGPASGAGNTVVIKTSEKAPLTSLQIAKLIVEAGFPPGVINILGGLGPVAGKALAEHMKIRKIAFTGSARTGRLIQQMAAASNLKAVSLELGGKSPMLVFEDADIKQAAISCATGILANSGQICVATSRVYVQESIREEFMRAYKAAMTAGKIGDVADRSITQGPQADKIQFDTVLRYLKEGKESGAKVELGGGRYGDGKGYFVEPTIFTDVPEDASIHREEIFGPVAICNTFKDEADGIRVANDTEQGLYASVFTQDVDRAIRVAKALEAGSVGVNQMGFYMQSDMPFGGYKQSGIGRENGSKIVDSWLEHKAVYFKYNVQT